MGAFATKGFAHRQAKVEFTEKQKEVGAQLPPNVFGPLEIPAMQVLHHREPLQTQNAENTKGLVGPPSSDLAWTLSLGLKS